MTPRNTSRDGITNVPDPMRVAQGGLPLHYGKNFLDTLKITNENQLIRCLLLFRPYEFPFTGV